MYLKTKWTQSALRNATTQTFQPIVNCACMIRTIRMQGSVRYIKSLLCYRMSQKYCTHTLLQFRCKNGRLSAQSHILLAGTLSIPWSSLDTGAYPPHRSPENLMILQNVFFLSLRRLRLHLHGRYVYPQGKFWNFMCWESSGFCGGYYKW